ncbi:AsnC family transcriptional regulator [uncultured Thiothrix sp.]|uniref:Lrp/AsnC family transcriptional regulator n=1 Tax=uncultured Thiothrix sp. TaxID=223185 RepID=UPI00263245D4|nr:AsnC family transcriptional regulator [uncultured Thiothrix sp.]HMT94720.1 AsnC family transcriptional regulator [Thiolinea sp.]
MNSMNKAILQRLRANSRMSWQQIGKEVHLTGQAVAARVQQLEDQGVISGYTIRQQHIERHFITMFMDVVCFDEFEEFLKNEAQVEGAYKITGEGCYHLIFTPESASELELFLQRLLKYGRYRVSSVLMCVK